MPMSRLLLCAVLPLGAAVAPASETVVTRLDINALQAAGQATATASPADIGGVAQVFDGDYGTLLRTPAINPAFVQVAFAQPQTLRLCKAKFSYFSQYRWRVESADSQQDLDSQTGTYAEIIPWTEFFDQDSVVALAEPHTARIFRLIVERLTGDDYVHIYEWELHADVEIASLAVLPVSHALVAGQQFQYVARGYDAAGFTYDLAPLAAWMSTDPQVASIGPDTGLCSALAPGGTLIAADLGTLAAPSATLTVRELLPAPAGLEITGYYSTAHVRWTPLNDPAVAGYAVFRRTASGQYPPEPQKRVLVRGDFTDYLLVPGATYYYQLAAIDGDGTLISEFTPEQPVTLATDPGPYSRHHRFELLMAFYRGGYTEAQVQQLTRGLELGLEFYWRTSLGRLNLDVTWLYLDGYPPGPDWYSSALQEDLRQHGVQDHQYDLAYLVGNDLAGCLGGYVVFGSTCASLGTVCGVPYPGKDPAVDYVVTWTFTHELHHALEVMENLTAGTPEVLFDHFPWCYPDPLGPTGWHMDWGSHYDGIALTNRTYGDSWALFPPPYDDYLECVDADGDGLPDADERVAMDELRLGADPTRADTDGDGLSDLGEYGAYNFRGTGVQVPDSDGDGRLDGADPQPLYPVRAFVPKLSPPPVIDGTIEELWPPLCSGYYFTRNGEDFELTTYAGWDGEALYLAIEATRKLRFMLSLDGSGADGRFESPVRHVAGTTDTYDLDKKQYHIGDTWGDGNHIYFAHGLTTVEVYGRGPAGKAVVASSQAGPYYRTELRLPRILPGGAAYTWYPPEAPVVDGLTLVPGQKLGLGLTMSNYAGSDGGEFSGTWTGLFETHAYVDFDLRLGGDLNCDGQLNALDIDPFVLALVDGPAYQAAYPDCDRDLADCNYDGRVDAFDIDVFVSLLTGADPRP